MKNLGLSSDYARVGIFFAITAVLVSLFYDFSVPRSYSGEYVVFDQEATAMRGQRPRHDFESLVGSLPDPERNRAAAPNFRDAGDEAFYYGSETPCFKVEIDENVDGNGFQADMFSGESYLSTSELFRSGLETAMAESFTEEVWARDQKCFNGSFVVSFDVDQEGRIGDNMLVHHIKGSSNAAGIAVLDVLRSMDLQGHRWHDGSAGAVEVRVPVKFKLES